MNVVLDKNLITIFHCKKKITFSNHNTSDFNEAGKKWSIIAPVFLDFSQVYLSYYKECIVLFAIKFSHRILRV
ncbi:hypothetical protein T08_13862 [Trichinella sp. T8]|nr:hypothetical protein T08_13862 [Trichinella sp. T8]